jgi:hypothetical protein
MTSLQALRAGGPCGKRSVERPNNPKEGLNGNSLKQINMSLGRGWRIYYLLIVDVCFDGSLTTMKTDSYDVDMCVIFQVLHGAQNGQNCSNPSPSNLEMFPSKPYISIGIAQSVQRLATSWATEGTDGVRVPVGSRIISSPRRPDRFWGPPDLLSNGYCGVKRPGREADHSPPNSAEVK